MRRLQSPVRDARGDVAGLRVAVYTDYAYHRLGGAVYAERAFALFIAELARPVGRLVLIGRLDPDPEGGRYPVGDQIEFVALPHYESLARPLSAVGAMLRSLGRLWRSLDEVECVWLLGPHPLAMVAALIAVVRRRRVILGVRQDLPAYVRSHRPGRPFLRLAALVLERSYRLLSRFCAVVVVGPDLRRHYGASRRLLEIVVSLVPEAALGPGAGTDDRDYEGELTILNVGRLDAEKNPMLLVDVLAQLNRGERRWRVVVCGEGPLEDELAAAFERAGFADAAELRGYVPLDAGLTELYHRSHAFLHTSWTEGLPQVLFEAFAAGLPVVATDVGGIADAVGDAALLASPGDAAASAGALGRIASDAELRAALVERGLRLVRAHTIESESRAVAAFLAES